MCTENIWHEAKVYEYLASTILNTVVGISTEKAQDLIDQAGGVHRLAQLKGSQLQKNAGIGPQRAEKILALTQWAVLLHSAKAREKIKVRTPTDVANLFMLEMGLLEQEELRLVSLNTRGYIQSVDTIYRGSVNAAIVRTAEIFRIPIILNCCQIVLMHNHPSGDPTPSPEDVHVTKIISDASRNLNIDLLDHLVIGHNRFVSLKERALGGL